MTAITNAGNLEQCKSRFSLIVEQIVAFASSPKMVRELKNLQINCVTMFCVIKVLIRIVSSILQLNSSIKNNIHIACT